MAETVTQKPAFDIEAVRKDFPALHQEVNGHPLVYLDSAATAQVPRPVLDAMMNYHLRDRANIHRGVHELSQRASASYDAVRPKIAAFLNSPDVNEVVFTKGTTDGLNLLASSYGRSVLKEGDEVVVSAMEHHSNIVPWQLICEETGATLKVIPMDAEGQLLMDQAKLLIGPHTKIVSVVHVSNALGTINPVQELSRLAHEHGAVCFVDGAQATPHMPVDVQELGCDAYVFSGHKVCGPSGVGALWARKELLEQMPPYQGGGDMILDVRFDRTVYNEVPLKFEAGTPNIAGVIGLGAAIDYLTALGMENIAAYEQALFAYATQELDKIDGIRQVGRAAERTGVYSFIVEGVPAYDIGTLLDQYGVAVRTGHHCTQPVMDFYGVSATSRASFAFYNTFEEVDRLVTALRKVISFF